MAKSTLRLSGQRFGPGALLLAEAAASEESEGPVWIQVAKEGTWKGHSQAAEINWDKEFFSKVVENFRSHPSYKAGPDGLGTEPVVPFDYEHASEMEPTSGTIPINGAGAPAWALDLKIQQGEEGVELWALTQLGDKAREQIRAGEYRWTSVAIWNSAIDPVSGNNIGPVLSSVAFTNHPFIQGMKPMVARVDVWGLAESKEELIVGLRDILELDETATSDRLVEELNLVHAAWQRGPQQLQLPGFPDGVGHLLDQVRRLLGLRVLATADEIVRSAGQALGAESDPPQPQPQERPPENQPMAENTLNSRIANVYGVKDKEEAILAAAEKGKEAQGSLERLQALFGSSDTQSLLQDAQAAIESAEKAKPLVEALTQAAGNLTSDDQQEVEAEVEQVAATNRGANRDDLRALATAKLLCKRFGEAMQRLGELEKAEAEAEVGQIVATLAPTEEAQKRLFPVMLSQRLEAGRDKAKLEEFRKQFPLPSPGAQYLQTPIAATQGGTQLGGQHTAHAPVQMGQQGQQTQQPQATNTHPLTNFPGRNRTEKAVSYLCSKREGFKQLPRHDQVFQAGQYLREGAPVL